MRIELLLAHSAGYVELFYGRPRTQSSWELVTDALARSRSGVLVGGAKRLYGIVEGGDFAASSRNGWTPTAGWCRICRHAFRDSSGYYCSVGGSGFRNRLTQTMERPPSKVPGWTDRSSGAGWLRGIRQRA